MLAKRLVGQLSASDDNEELIISKLKQVCGSIYTSKLEQMFQDIRISKTLVDEYKTFCENQQHIHTIDFSVMVLSTNIWPFRTRLNLILPDELKSTFDSFMHFYNHRHNSRKLTWLHQYSKGELVTKQTNILQVSMYQMMVLLLFNKSLNWTIERMKDETEIKTDLLLQIVYGLLKSKLLTCAEIMEDFEETDIKLDYNIQLATDFNNDKIRINLNIPLKSIKQKEPESLHRTIDEERHMVIQATIVRIMKARQKLKYALLMREVIQQLPTHFQPRISLIKKCIDILIEKEYLGRDSNEKDVLYYIT